jgi:aminopeptidase N
VWKTEEGIGRHLLELETEAIRLSEAPQFVQANVSYAGFYITSYAGGQYATLRKHMGKVGVEERLGLVHDFYYFVLSGKYTVAEFVEFVENFFLQEQNPTVLSYVISKLSGLYLLLEKATIAEVASQLAHSALQRIAWEPVADEDPEHVVLRNVCLYALGLFGNEQTYQFALDKFAAFLEDESRLHQDLRGTIYALAVWAADENYGKVLELYKKTEVQEEKAKFLAALARTRNRTLLLQTLDYALSTEVSFSNTVYIFSSLSRNPAAKDLTVDWIRGHWEALVQSGGGMAEMILRYILKYTIPQFGIGREKLVEEFLGSVKGVGLQKTFEQIKEELEIHSRMVERNK